MAYIVVSDVHLGGKFCNHAKFCGFLDWLKGLETKEETINCKGKDVRIQRPEKVILLGDILELWDPEGGDRDNVIKAGIKPFTVLSDLKCDKIYVVGNHDEALSELEKEVNDETLPNKTKFIIKNRHYPQNHDGLKIGNHNYFFLHGQQFDKEQDILKRVSGLIGESWDPLGWFQSLFNITSTKKHWKTYFMWFAAMFLGVGYFILSGLLGNFSGLFSNIIQNLGLAKLNTILTGLVGIISILVGAGVVFGLGYILWNKLYRMFFLLSVIILGGWYFWEKSSLWILIWGALTGFFALSSIPGVVANTQRKFYNMMKPKDKTAKEIIEGDGYYKKEKDTITADRVVFGHTHFASSFKTPEKIFINSGCWIGTYLINWNEIPGKSNERLIDFLKQNYDIDWAMPKIEKTDDGNNIIVSNGEKSLSLRLNPEKTIVYLKIDDGRTDEFIVKEEKDKPKPLNIYTGINKQIGNERRYSNTFVYMDESGAYLLSWINKDKIECIEAF